MLTRKEPGHAVLHGLSHVIISSLSRLVLAFGEVRERKRQCEPIAAGFASKVPF